jgi:predicted dehydrogenase
MKGIEIMKKWKIGLVKDTSKPTLGLHGLDNAFRGLPDVEIVAHVDSIPDNLVEKLNYTGAKRHYLSYIEMLNKEKPDIVILCSRHPYDHFEHIKAAAERGIHIYCEKPMTVSLEEADQIIKLAEKYGIKICIAHPARYSLAFLTMKEMVMAGDIGVPMMIYGRGKCDHRGGGEDLIVLGTHILDLQIFFFGSPEYVFADVSTDGKPVVKTDRNQTVEPIGPVSGDEIFAYFRFPGDVRGTFESKQGLFDRESGIIHMGITVFGTKGTLSLRFNDNLPFESSLRISKTSAPPEDFTIYENVPLTETRIIHNAEPLDFSRWVGWPGKAFFLESNRYAAYDLMQSIEEDRLPLSNQFNARLVLEMIYGIYASHLSGQKIHFPLINRNHPLDH